MAKSVTITKVSLDNIDSIPGSNPVYGVYVGVFEGETFLFNKFYKTTVEYLAGITNSNILTLLNNVGAEDVLDVIIEVEGYTFQGVFMTVQILRENEQIMTYKGEQYQVFVNE